MKNVFASSLLLIITSFLLAQAPQGIPYQAVMRNADGTVMSSSSVNLTFMIHDGSATGTIVFEETHALTSNNQGLVSCVVGNGVVSQGNFSNINWGSGAKFLHVMMGTTDLGTQQMLSVPYALYAEKSGEIHVDVSSSGDTLFIGEDNFVLIPGLSIRNGPQGNTGLTLLPGNDTCDDQFISVTGCGGQTSLAYDDRTYDLVEIGGQCWFAENLATDQYRDGDPIPTGLDNTTWVNTNTGAYAVYNSDPSNDFIYGKLYNWYTTIDTRGLCPTGWHVPSDCEWMFLESSLGMSPWLIETTGFRGTDQGGKMKSTNGWTTNAGAANSSGFMALPGGYRDNFGFYMVIGDYGAWWSTSGGVDASTAWGRGLNHGNSKLNRGSSYNYYGFSVRCLKD